MKKLITCATLIFGLGAPSANAIVGVDAVVVPCDETHFCLPIPSDDSRLKATLYTYACMAEFGDKFESLEGLEGHPACKIRIGR